MAHAATIGTPVPKNYLNADKGIWSWMTTVDHKRIGIMYLVSVMTAFLLGGVFALLVRLGSVEPQAHAVRLRAGNGGDVQPALHAARRDDGVPVHHPVHSGGAGQLRAAADAGRQGRGLPALNLASYYIYVTGVIFALTSLVTGAVDTGWTFYTPYSTTTQGSVTLMTLAAFILGFSSILTGINFIVTIHKLRAPGMAWFRMPLFVWGIYATAIIQVLATPVLGITLLLLMMERVFSIGIFDPELGGDPVLFQHFFWFYSHPAVYIMILPGMAIITEVIPTFSQKTIFGYRSIAFSSVAIALIGFLVWGHHMFVAGQSPLASVIFSFLTFLVAIPSAIKVFNWLATMCKATSR